MSHDVRSDPAPPRSQTSDESSTDSPVKALIDRHWHALTGECSAGGVDQLGGVVLMVLIALAQAVVLAAHIVG